MTAVTDTTVADEAAAAKAHTAWLLRLGPDEIAHYSFGTILDWLDARREQHIARLRTAIGELRVATEATAAAHERLAALVTARTTP